MCRRLRKPAIPSASYLPWYGIYVPASTPDDIVEKSMPGINKALENPGRAASARDRRHPGQADAADDSRTLMKTDYEKLTPVVKAAGIPQQ